VNILFVNYGDFTTNSLNHIGGFANTLSAAGHACAVAVPRSPETLRHIPHPLFIATTYAEALSRPHFFPDGRGADLIHAWTPRECVRQFTVGYQRAIISSGHGAPARLIIHLEDNERFLIESFTGLTWPQLRATSVTDLEPLLNESLPHPLRSETFLRVADGVTHIIEQLAEFAPPGLPTLLLFPGVDFEHYRPQTAEPALRTAMGLRDEEKVIVFTGSNTFANEPEMRELYLAVALLNQRGLPTRLVRTGFNSPRFLASIAEDVTRHVIDLGFIAKNKLPALLALADALVQPGRPGPFNDYRLPSKLPEFLASGKPVILPPTNLARLMTDGREAMFLPPSGAPTAIADTLAGLFADPARSARLGEHGAAFARQHFDLATNTRALADFYTATLARPATSPWPLAQDPTTSDATLFATTLAAQLNQAAATLDDPAAHQLAHQTELLADLTRALEQAIDAAARHHRTALAAAETRHLAAVDALLAREKLTHQHVKNIEDLLAAARAHAAGLEESRGMTQVFADNLGRELAQHKRRREQADILLRTGRLQVTAYENALLGADAEIASLKDDLATITADLRIAHSDTNSARSAHAADRAASEHQIATERALAAQQLAQANALTRSRDQKIATMQASFSWRATAPFRALRRAFLDRPAAPTPSIELIGNIDYPQDWSNIAPTLNVRGWSLHRDRRPLRAIRASLDRQPVSAEFGLERLDVLDHFRDYPGAERCGWIVKVEVPRFGHHTLLIEAQDEAGTWHIAVARTVKRTADATPPPPNTYGAWVATYDTLTPDEADRIRAKIAALPQRPLISVLMPTYNTPEKWLVAAIESVRRQLYENWELCIADDASKEPHVRKILERYLKKDPRIKVVFRESNGHISAASNSALALAHGDFIALLDHDDEIRPHALACVALELDAHPLADLIYSDEDKIDENGHRYDHYFKPDWNPDLFNVQNYVSHLGVYRTLLIREVGGFRVGYEGSQDWDLAMRVIERSAPDRIRHIPRILYHWRSVPGSTAMLIGAKSYATQAAEKVITEHLLRSGVNARISPTKGSYWRVHYPVPSPAPLVTLIIPTRNRLNFLKPCIESLLAKTTYPRFEILIVDNGSDDPATLDYLTAVTQVDPSAPAPAATVRVVTFPGEFNFSAINNFGVSQTTAPLVGLLNNDLEIIHGDWLDEMVSQALRPEIGCVGAKLYYPDDRIQHAGVILGIGGIAAHAWQTHPRGAAGQAHRNLLQQNLSAVTAACLLIRREVFLQVGGLNADQLKVAFNDVDFCLKVRATGLRNLWTPYAELYHHESASRGQEDTLEKRDRFRSEVEYMSAQWGDALLNDPAYNPNLTLTINDFTLASPPRPWRPLI